MGKCEPGWVAHSEGHSFCCHWRTFLSDKITWQWGEGGREGEEHPHRPPPTMTTRAQGSQQEDKPLLHFKKINDVHRYHLFFIVLWQSRSSTGGAPWKQSPRRVTGIIQPWWCYLSYLWCLKVTLQCDSSEILRQTTSFTWESRFKILDGNVTLTSLSSLSSNKITRKGFLKIWDLGKNGNWV